MADREEKNSKQRDSTVKPRRERQTEKEVDFKNRRVDPIELQQATVSPEKASPAAMLGLQQAGGNQAVSRLIQTKLVVGPAVDSYEMEADRVADRVVNMPAPTAPTGKTTTAQTKPADTIQKVDDTAGPTNSKNGFEAGPDVESRLSAQKGRGSPMSEGILADMSSRFGTDFSGVHIHTGGMATQLSRDLNAQAFTQGQDIFFAQGKYNPGTSEGKRLLAHELTHVVQQTGSVRTKRQPAAFPLMETGSGDKTAQLSPAVMIANTVGPDVGRVQRVDKEEGTEEVSDEKASLGTQVMGLISKALPMFKSGNWGGLVGLLGDAFEILKQLPGLDLGSLAEKLGIPSEAIALFPEVVKLVGYVTGGKYAEALDLVMDLIPKVMTLNSPKEEAPDAPATT